jgi:hypothetical protein
MSVDRRATAGSPHDASDSVGAGSDPVARLIATVAGAMEQVCTASQVTLGTSLDRYLGDIVEITFDGDDERIALRARLLAVASTTQRG